MSRPQFTPSYLDDFSMRLRGEWVQGKPTPHISVTYRGNAPRIQLNMNDNQKSRVDVRLDSRMMFNILTLIEKVVSNPEPTVFKLRFDKYPQTRPGEKRGKPAPDSWVFVGRDRNTSKIYLAVSCANNTELKARVFFESPHLLKIMDEGGNPLHDQMDSELNATAFVESLKGFYSTLLITNYTSDWGGGNGGGGRSGGGGGGGYNRGGGGGYGNNNSGGGQTTTDFLDSDIPF